MVHYHRHHQQRKVDEESQEPYSVLECGNVYKMTKPTLLRFFFIFSIISCSFIFVPRLFGASPFFYLEDGNGFLGTGADTSSCSSTIKGSICCDRSSIRSDTCFMKGDIRTNSSSSSIFLYSPSNTTQEEQHKIKPYTRKWETSVMNTIDELTIIKARSFKDDHQHSCEVHHSVPAIFFSTGGYTGNLYHEFNDGILPLYITSQHLKGEVVFVILEYHDWWITKYGEILNLLSNYPPVDFTTDKRTHCFSEAMVGLKIHDELTVNSSLLQDKKGIKDFRNLLDEAYTPRIRALEVEEPQETEVSKPKLVIVSRNGSRALLNEESVVRLAEEIGFKVEVILPNPSTELAKIYRALNSCDVMVGVHGAAMTHFLFMRPGSVFVQVVPLGTDWAAQTYYGEPATKLGIKYTGYKIMPRESSLYGAFDRDDPVLTDPDSVNAKGWEVTKKVYLDGQNVMVDLKRFRRRLVRAYDYTVAMARRRKEVAVEEQHGFAAI